tara:strand:+ start:549 stop:767 length:219 start_codon:yes stop_codon:yes gene_type:complete
MKSISELVNNIIEGWDHDLPEVQQNLSRYEVVWDALRERELERDYYLTDAYLESLPDSEELKRIEAHPKYES